MTGVAGQAEIRRALPHRFPMLLVDRVLDIVPGERITALKAVTCNEPWYAEMGADAPPESYAYPRMLLTESWCQSAGVLATWTSPGLLDGRVMLFGGISDVVHLRPVLPGDVVRHEARVTRDLGDTVLIEGESLVADEPVMTVARASLAFRPAEHLRAERPGTELPGAEHRQAAGVGRRLGEEN
ncbi:3-hydroxyacyl-ACP dehydratase FabZ family protein [Streptomyces sp. SBT349]|uniref:3-hydroxyacyl-ACP dehydratase FabZ family protein n=1 Tax=Streptomyces sp. SBT349 TaxID=1580539 RepID=UPI0007C6E6FD|nr:3-hydroxyacyl-ACP dehydratase FabZ family protein [Streptomyces sp. SBT349]